MGIFTDIVQMYKLNKAINSACSITRKNKEKYVGYGSSLTEEGQIKICTGMTVRYIGNFNFELKDNEVVS